MSILIYIYKQLYISMQNKFYTSRNIKEGTVDIVTPESQYSTQ